MNKFNKQTCLNVTLLFHFQHIVEIRLNIYRTCEQWPRSEWTVWDSRLLRSLHRSVRQQGDCTSFIGRISERMTVALKVRSHRMPQRNATQRTATSVSTLSSFSVFDNCVARHRSKALIPLRYPTSEPARPASELTA